MKHPSIWLLLLAIGIKGELAYAANNHLEPIMIIMEAQLRIHAGFNPEDGRPNNHALPTPLTKKELATIFNATEQQQLKVQRLQPKQQKNIPVKGKRKHNYR